MESGKSPINERSDEQARFFHETVIALSQLTSELIGTAKKEGYNDKDGLSLLVTTASTLLVQFDPIKLIESFIRLAHDQYWNQINSKDEDFFKNNATVLFKNLPIGGINPFELLTLKNKKGEYYICKDDRDAIWEYFFSLVRLSIKYVHYKRQPIIRILENGDKKPVYGKKEFIDVKLEKHAKLWGVPLDFHNRG